MTDRVNLVVLALLFGASNVRAAEALPTTPILRIDTGRHSAFIHALALDESAGRLYSASEDKTVRVWRMSDGRLLDTFRVPIGTRSDGQLYALALSPDRRTLAVAGWTCWDTEGSACIYLLDAETGALTARIAGLPEVVAALRFSPDGTRLAAGMMGRGGLQVYRLSDRTLVARDAAYRDKLLELDFTRDGRLVAASLDGFLRLYDRQLTLIGRIDAGLAGHQPFGLRCSPDGRFIAVGFNDVAHVSVLDARDLKPIRTLNVAAPAPRNLTRLGWSPDSSALYATGEPLPRETATVFRWRVAGSALADRAFVTEGRIGDLAVTRDQSVAFASDEPSLGMLDAAGKIRYRLLSGIPNYGADVRLRVARDGSEVEVAGGPASGELRRFSVLRGTLARLTAPSADLMPPVTSSREWRVTQWGKPDGPYINGNRIALEPYEEPHAFTIVANAGTLLIGTEWALRATNAHGDAKWIVRTSTAVRAVNSSQDGRYAVAALADGTLNWYALSDGTLLLSLFVHADGESWVAWTPAGYYASSVYGDSLVGWQINRGADRSPDFFRAVQFERELYRPDLVAARMTGARISTAEDARQLLTVAPPRVAINVIADTPAAGVHSRRVRITGESRGLPMRDVVAYVNDIPVTRAHERTLQAAEAAHFAREIDLPLDQAENEVRVEVSNGRSLGVTEKLVAGTGPSQATERGDLYVLAVGANAFPALDRNLYLSYAARDAEDIARALGAGKRDFNKVHVQTLSDGGTRPTRAAVLAALEQLERAGGRDTVILFLASHGVSDAAGNYFFVPRDARKADIDLIVNNGSLPAESSLIGWRTFFDALRKTAGKRLLIVDTCEALSITGRVQEFSLIKRSASSHIAFIMASKADEESQEYPPAQHGLFTYALLAGLGGAADVDRDGRITVAEWFRFAAVSVERLRDRRIGPQTPQFMAPRALQTVQIPRD